MYTNRLVEGFRIGNSDSERGQTGCTVVICDEGACAGVDVRGAAPGTRETDLLKPENSVEKIHACVLSGGSAFGLEASSGVMKYLEEKNIGFDTGVVRVPIVCQAVLFDLATGDSSIRPDKEMGYLACKDSEEEKSFTSARAGAGKGATVSKVKGFESAMKGGLGVHRIELEDGIVVAAIIAVNALGDIYDGDEQLTGPIEIIEKEKVMLSTKKLLMGGVKGGFAGLNTTIGIVLTNVNLNKAQCLKVSQMAHDGYARAINPVHTPHDGDTIFTMASGKMDYQGDITKIGICAAEAVRTAIVKAACIMS